MSTRITAEQEQWARRFARCTMSGPEIKAYNRRNGTVYQGIDQLLEAEPGEDVFKFYREAWVAGQAERRSKSPRVLEAVGSSPR